jgi:hypothetical protein
MNRLSVLPIIALTFLLIGCEAATTEAPVNEMKREMPTRFAEGMMGMAAALPDGTPVATAWPGSPLVGRWELVKVVKDGIAQPLPEEQIKVNFSSKGVLEASDGCNMTYQKYTATTDGGFSSNGYVVVTGKACYRMGPSGTPRSVGNSELVSSVLRAQRWEIRDGNLWLYNDADHEVLVFR